LAAGGAESSRLGVVSQILGMVFRLGAWFPRPPFG
jgi:hypothetical protein